MGATSEQPSKLNKMAKANLKRSYAPENRVFKEEWELEFFFLASSGGKCVCLICDCLLAQFKRSNLQRHHTITHPTFANDFPVGSELRREKLKNLKLQRKVQQNFFCRNTSQKVATASYQITYEIMKRMKPYTDGEMIKECMLLTCATLFPDKYDLVKEMKKLQLSDSTVCRRATDIAENVEMALREKFVHSEFISVAMDESLDINDIPQLLIFIRATDTALEVTEEFLDMVSLENGTTGEEIKKASIDTIHKFNIQPKNISAITTDGAPAMLGKRNGAVA